MTDQAKEFATDRRATRGMSIAERLDYHAMPELNTGCWIWMLADDGGGYGLLQVKGKSLKAHRLQWERFNGPIPEGMRVCHHCDVRCCVNPDHLFLCTHRENMEDAARKGRIPRGEKAVHSKLTADQARAILKDERSSRVIGLDYGISKTSVCDIKIGKNWKHIQN